MRLHRGETLFRQGESGPLYRIDAGLLKIVRTDPGGTPFIFNIIAAGETIPHHSLISPKEYHGTAIALTACEITMIPAKEWYGELEREPSKYRETALLLQSRLRTMQQRIDQLTALEPAEKLKRLNRWFASYVPDAPLGELLTQEEIGQLLGLRRETVNRLLRRLRAEEGSG
ncbi:Crp/Fnr family transcriptional regulator [Paenibacillus humicola]|uniref:Crp/Fnr family transcriptional regulator n=1 Tax=Paenibacillus humicola TaxID=3110540 RepID=UPI00237C00F7|nr:Crp/Fnr family transcriptional regulator [Paenibacillus humicola]